MAIAANNKNILLHASYFANNFGDVFLWDIIKDIIAQEAPEYNLYYANIPTDLVKFYDPEKRMSRATRAQPLRIALFSGGGYLTPPSKGKLKWHLRNFFRHRRAVDLACGAERVAFLGVGVGRLAYSPLGWLLRRIPQSSIVTAWLRDSASSYHFRELFPETPTSNVDDLVFAHLSATYDRNITVRPSVQRLGLHVDLSGMSPEKQRILFQAIDTLNEAFLGEVVLFTDCESPNAKHTRQELVRRLKHKPTEIVFQGKCDTFLTDIVRCSYIITTKLHVGICAAACRVPVLSIPAHPKTPRFYSKIGMPHAIANEGKLIVESLLQHPSKYTIRDQVLHNAANDYARLSEKIRELIK